MDGDSDLKGPSTDDLNCPIGRIRRRTRIEDTRFVRRNVARNFLIVVLLFDYYYNSCVVSYKNYDYLIWFGVPRHGSNTVPTWFQRGSNMVPAQVQPLFQSSFTPSHSRGRIWSPCDVTE